MDEKNKRNEMNKMWDEDKIRKELHKAADMELIPEGLKPENIKAKLNKTTAKAKKKSYKWWYTTAAAACLFIVIFAAKNQLFQIPSPQKESVKNNKSQSASEYEEIYNAFSKLWEEETTYMDEDCVYDIVEAGEESRADMSIQKSSSEKESSTGTADEQQDYGRTNQQEEAVEEADIIKNDGRYLYQIIQSDEDYQYRIQITDTKNGLEEIVKVGAFDDIHNIYVYNDWLIVLEAGWIQTDEPIEKYNVTKGSANITADIGWGGSTFTKIHIYDISNRTNPKEYHTFTVKGDYRDSRISDGYLYYFAQVQAEETEDPKDYDSYLPLINDKPMEAKDIYLPKVVETDSYLVMTSVNLEKPDTFTDTKAIVTSADRFYVSEKNIYVTDILQENNSEQGENSNRTKIYRFSYNSGTITKEAEGEVQGILLDDMAMNEYQGYLRLVTTVESYELNEVIDDISGESIGYESIEQETSNSLYILDKNLKISGRIENLAKGEEVYSVRFMKDTGYFVTFRQTDPLFSVDLSNPREPKILGELKINGFSEYLHVYTKDLLLGIGMEADEEGITQGMKLSMFDISNPSDVTEESKLNLSEYDDSQALYDYKAVFIDTNKNIFGFLARSYREEEVREYLLFSYEDGDFKQEMTIECSDYEIYGNQIRGTYIGDSFYLMGDSGRIEEYSLADGSMTDELN